MDNVPIGAPDVDAVREWLGLDPEDHLDDQLIATSLDASIAAQSRTLVWPCNDDGDPQFDPDIYEATLLRCLRLMARRSSPESVVGLSGTGGDLVAARLPTLDSDVLRLESPFLKVVVS